MCLCCSYLCIKIFSPSAYRHPVTLFFKRCWCCKFEVFSLLLLAVLLRLNLVSNSQHWLIRCWSRWVGWEEVCSPTLEAVWPPTLAVQEGGNAAGKSPHCSYGRWPCLGQGSGTLPQLPLSQKKNDKLNPQLCNDFSILCMGGVTEL